MNAEKLTYDFYVKNTLLISMTNLSPFPLARWIPVQPAAIDSTLDTHTRWSSPVARNGT